MKVAHYTNDFSLHQINLADELYALLGDDFKYFEMCENVDAEKSSYLTITDRPYLVRVWKNERYMDIAKEWAATADAALFSSNDNMVKLICYRLERNLITFEGGERWFKRGLINIFSPRLLRSLWWYHTFYYKKPIYKLCSSAYGAGDQYKLFSFKDRCYKWGYFTKVDDIDLASRLVNTSKKVTIMWCARYLKLKHPELVIYLAYRLKQNGYSITIDMYGYGAEFENTRTLCEKLCVDDVVNFYGKMSNKEILEAMRNHDIFLFTSDRHEGWGAVVNEAMSNACAVVSSDAVGSTAFLIQEKKNGMIFKSGSIESLYDKVSYLIDNPGKRIDIATNAYVTMRDIWSPRQGAINFIQLSEDLLNGRDSSVTEGPCSKALPI